MTRIQLQWTDDNPVYGRTTYMDRDWSVDTLLLSDNLGGMAPSVRMYLHRAGRNDRTFEQRVDYPVINWDREHGRYPEWADIDDGINDITGQPAMGADRRIWLVWDNDKASSLIDGRIWDVELASPEQGGMLGLNLITWGSAIRKIVVNWDREHGMHPEWVDCASAEGHMMSPQGTAMHDAGLAAAEFFRNEIREDGIMRRLRPVPYASDRVLVTTPDMPRHQVELMMTLGDTAQELHGHIADMPMPTREQLEQGIRSMQATAVLSEGEAERIREWTGHRIADSIRGNELVRMAEDPDLSPETREVAWSMLNADRLMRDPDIQDAALRGGISAEELARILADTVHAEARRAIVSDEQHPLVWYPVPQRITSGEAR